MVSESFTFAQRAVITLLDKGILALFLALAVYYLNRLLQNRKARDETIRELADSRAKVYEKLWSILALVRAHGPIPKDLRTKLESDLTRWYHDESGALYTSWETTKHLFLALDALRNNTSTDKVIRDTITLLRTRLKYDCGIYSSGEVKKQLPTPRPSPRASPLPGNQGMNTELSKTLAEARSLREENSRLREELDAERSKAFWRR